MRLINNELRLLVLTAVVEESVLAVNFVGGNPASFVDIWSSDCPYFVKLHHNSRHLEVHFPQPYNSIVIWLIQLLLLYLVPQQLQVVLKVVNVSDLARNSNSFSVFCSYLSVVYQRVQGILYFKLEPPFIVLQLRVYLALVGFEYQIARYHDSCPSLSCLAVNRSHIVRSSLEPSVAVLAEFKNHIEGWGVVVIERKMLTH